MLSATALISAIAPGQEALPMTQRQALHGSLLVFAQVLGMYWLTFYVFPGRVSADVSVYLLRPLFWLAAGFNAYYFWLRLPERPAFSRLLLGLGAVAGLFQISVLLCAGVLFSFGHSPYSRQLFHMTENVWYLSAFIIGLEMSRAYLLAVWSRYNAVAAFAAVSLLFMAIWLSPGQFDTVFAGRQNSLHTFSRTFMPGIAESAMATFLASLGGALPAIVYHLSLEAFRWLSPILPRLDWQVAAFIGTLAPALAMLIVRDAFFAPGEKTDEAAADESQGKGGISPLVFVLATAVVAMIWLNTGMLGVKPALVSGPSMKPYLGPGDIVMTKEVDASTLKVGDVVKFDVGPREVIHRITAVQPTNTGPVFVTQGDNTNVADRPLTAAQIKGKVVLKLPYVGWLPIKIKEVLSLN